jgi:hypothetical protein
VDQVAPEDQWALGLKFVSQPIELLELRVLIVFVVLSHAWHLDDNYVFLGRL